MDLDIFQKLKKLETCLESSVLQKITTNKGRL